MNASFSVSRTAARTLLGIAAATLLVSATDASAKIHKISREEARLFEAARKSADQGRRTMRLDPILCQVARQRAKDMARKDYYSHTDPSGKGPNYKVRKAGFKLPSYYDRSKAGNNIESLAKARGNFRTALGQWKNSPHHYVHVFAKESFFRDQKAVGVGIYRSPQDPSIKYFVFLSAPENTSKRPPRVVLVSPKGKKMASTKSRKSKSAIRKIALSSN